MDRDWALEAEVRLNNKTMEELLIEAFGCVPVNNRVIKVFVSNDRRMMKREFCIDGTVVDSQMMHLPAMLEDSSATWGRGLFKNAFVLA